MISGQPFSGTSPLSHVPPSRARAPAGGAVSCTTRSRERAFTLVELVVVVVIMATLLGVAVLAGGEASAKGREAATLSSMQAIREAIVGGSSELFAGTRVFRRDVPNPGLPRNVTTVPAPVAPTWSVTQLLVGTPASEGRPYVSAPRARYEDRDFGLLPRQPVNQRWSDYGTPNDWAILDGWGNPIVLQVPDLDGDGVGTSQDERRHARLVSAGDNGRIDTPFSILPDTEDYPFFASCGDDIVLYLEVADLRR